MLSRRTFVSWLSGVGAAIGAGLRLRPAHAASSLAPNQAAPLDPTSVTRLAEVVLPAELGDAGFGRVSRAFTEWAAAYREGAELNHPYGSAEIRHTGTSPSGRWRLQLAELDRDARSRHQSPFNTLTVEQRKAIVTAALASDRTNRMPDPLSANHVALALVAWFFASPEATNLCYNAKIDRNQCRPLVNAPRQPLPLRGPGTGDRGPQ